MQKDACRKIGVAVTDIVDVARNVDVRGAGFNTFGGDRRVHVAHQFAGVVKEPPLKVP